MIDKTGFGAAHLRVVRRGEDGLLSGEGVAVVDGQLHLGQALDVFQSQTSSRASVTVWLDS